jgi:putative phosphoesterase
MACIADIHGNLPALQAVLGRIEEDEVDDVIVAGDILLGGDGALDVWRELKRVGARCVRGTSDTALVTMDPARLHPISEVQRERFRRFVDTQRSVGELVLAELRRLPLTLRVPLVDGTEMVVVHGSPSDPDTEMTHDLGDDELSALIGDDPADVVVCGSSHVPFERTVGGVHVVNVGSVGSAPEGRVAHYTIITPRLEGTKVEQHWVEY